MTEDRRDDPGEVRPGQQGRSWTDEEIIELLPGFALGALEPDEMLAVEQYLTLHPEWQERLYAYEQATASLAHTAPRATLPSRAKERLLQRVRADAPVAQPRKNPFAAAPPPPVRTTPRGLRPIRRPQPQPAAPTRSWFGVFWRTFAVAGAVAAIILLAVLTNQLRGQVAQLSSQLATVQGQLTQLQADNARLHQINTTLEEQMRQQTLIAEILRRPQQVIALDGLDPLPTASGMFYRRDNQSVLLLHGLPPLPPDQTYQLWILPPDGGPSIPADLLPVANQDATFELAIAPEHSNLIGVGVSVEAAGGSQTVPTTVILLGTQTNASA